MCYAETATKVFNIAKLIESHRTTFADTFLVLSEVLPGEYKVCRGCKLIFSPRGTGHIRIAVDCGCEIRRIQINWALAVTTEC